MIDTYRVFYLFTYYHSRRYTNHTLDQLYNVAKGRGRKSVGQEVNTALNVVTMKIWAR